MDATLNKLNKQLVITGMLQQKLTECLIATTLYQHILDSIEAEHTNMHDPKHLPKTNWEMSRHQSSFLQDSMLFAAHRLMVWLNIYRDNYSIKNTNLQELLKFQDGLKQLRDLRTHDYDYSLSTTKSAKKTKVQENYENYIVKNELGTIGPNITYSFKDCDIEDQHNIGGRFRFDLFMRAVELAFKKTKDIGFFDTSDLAKQHFELDMRRLQRKSNDQN